MHKALRYLKVNGKMYDKGEIINLSKLSKKETARLVKKGFVEEAHEVKANKTPPTEEVAADEIENPTKDSSNLSEEEVKAELLGKLNHGIVVNELKLLGADFKANASFEKLVELIMENEDYENHFLDYIDDNEL